MRTLLIVFLLASQAQAATFQGIGEGAGEIHVEQFDGTGHFQLDFAARWLLTLSTNVQSMTMSGEIYDSDTVFFPNNFSAAIEFSLQTSYLPTLPLNLDPWPLPYTWQTQAYSIPQLNISGAYFSYGPYMNTFGETFTTSEEYTTYIDFEHYPDSLVWLGDSNGVTYTPSGIVELEPNLKITHIVLYQPTGTEFAARACPCCFCGDFNLDGNHDGADLLSWQLGVGKANPSLSDGDGNGDGFVNRWDLDFWRGNYSINPEPGTQVMAILACLFLICRRTR